MAFLPYESRVFTLDYRDACQDFYAQMSGGKSGMADRIADQLATICAMLGEYPAIRYRRYYSGPSHPKSLGPELVQIFEYSFGLISI